MKIAVDAMGGDNAPVEIIKGCIHILDKRNDINIMLVGNENIIKKELQKYNNINNEKIEIVNASEVISTDESAVQAVKKKSDSSMVKGLELIKKHEADAFISAGSTGALMVGALFKVGRIKGIDRPGLGPVIPSKKGRVMLIDVGANANCRPINLIQFATMGSIYMKNVLNIENPKIGLLNIGTEEEKGNELTKVCYAQLKDKFSYFVGNVESRNILDSDADVLVCDGFTGNMVLKCIEGVAIRIFKMLKKELTKDLKSKLAALILKPGIKNVVASLDYTEYGGTPLLGIDGNIIKAHGSSNSYAFENAILQAVNYVNGNVVETIKNEISKMED